MMRLMGKDTGEDDRPEGMVEYDGEAGAEGDTDEDVADATYYYCQGMK